MDNITTIHHLILMSFALMLSGCESILSEMCEQTGGKWGTVKSECIRPSCAKAKTCGRWSSSAHFCKQVKIGDSKDNVRFWLSEPDNETHQSMIGTPLKLKIKR